MGRLLFLWCFVMFGCVSDFDTECVVDDDCKGQESRVDNQRHRRWPLRRWRG